MATSIAVVGSLLTSCASEQYKAEERARRVQKDREAARQAEVLANAVGLAVVTPEAQGRATSLLANLNRAASQNKQYDADKYRNASELPANPTPLFVLDTTTGKLSLRLTTTASLEFMLRHIEQVRLLENRTTASINGQYPISFKTYQVVLEAYSHHSLIRATGETGTGHQWRNSLTLVASDERNAKEILEPLRALRTVYSSAESAQRP